jgi:hypothetical protein
LTVLQENVPRAAISRVSAYDWLGSLIFMPAGFALAGPVSDAIGIDATLWTAAGLIVAANLAIVAVPSVRRLRSSAPEPTVPTAAPPLAT